MPPVELAAPVARQLGKNDDAARNLAPGELAAAVLDDALEIDRRRGGPEDRAQDGAGPLRSVYTENADVVHTRKVAQEILDLARLHVLALDDDQVVGAAEQAELPAALLVPRREVSGYEAPGRRAPGAGCGR